MPTASASTESVNNSREPVRATLVSTHGTTLGPNMIASTVNTATFASVITSVSSSDPPPASAPCAPAVSAPVPPRISASAGKSTSASTVTRSSTTSQPMATRPPGVLTWLRSSSDFNCTTVLATDMLRPSTMPAPRLHPHNAARPMPSGVASRICPTAPGIATPRTASRSEAEKCRPTPNISRMTPISASCEASSASAMKPGVNGPIRMPATRKPTSGGRRRRSAR